MRLLLSLVALAACNTESSIERADSHFDPPTGTTLAVENPVVRVVDLDAIDVCYALDTGDPGYGSSCVQHLDATRQIALSCGFHTVYLRWGDASDELEQASYRVESPSCTEEMESEDPPQLWQNDELVRAFVAIKDDLQCRMNDCKNPSIPGSWQAACGEGEVTWTVKLDGLRALSEFNYRKCRASTTIEVHDPQDPWWHDAHATIALSVELVLDGTIYQDTNFSGDGDEAGIVDIRGDFQGQVESLIEIAKKARSGGGFVASCTDGNVNGEICAPNEAAIRYDYPEWMCYGDVCPKIP